MGYMIFFSHKFHQNQITKSEFSKYFHPFFFQQVKFFIHKHEENNSKNGKRSR